MNGLRHSFDVFDTSLTRTFARPADLFAELGRIQGAADPEAWRRSRVEAQRRARTASIPTAPITAGLPP